MGTLRNARHEKFVQCLISGKSQRTAYREAFAGARKWKDSVVDSKASTLLKSGKVLERYEELQKALEDKAILDATQRMELLSGMALDKEERTENKIRAIDTLNKMDGVYTNKIEVSGGVALDIEEKEKAIDKYLDDLLGMDEVE